VYYKVLHSYDEGFPGAYFKCNSIMQFFN
jgi:hypothetical protein